MAENYAINSSTNYPANSYCVLRQTAEIILVHHFNLVNKREIKVKNYLIKDLRGVISLKRLNHY